MLKDKEGDPEAGDNIIATKGGATKRAEGSDAADTGAGTLFITKATGIGNAKALDGAADAAKAVGAVSGADILRAVIADGGKAVLLAKNATDNEAADAEEAGVMIGNVAREATAKVLETFASKTLTYSLNKALEGSKGAKR